MRDSGRLFRSAICAINKFHGLAHQAKCRNRLSVCVTRGAGLCDGEQTERGWSDLRPHGRFLKYMRQDRRTFTIAYILRNFNAQQILGTPNWLSKRLKLLRCTTAKFDSELELLLQESNELRSVGVFDRSTPFTEADLLTVGRKWHEEMLAALAETEDSSDPLVALRGLAVERSHWKRQCGLSGSLNKFSSCNRRVKGIDSDMKCLLRKLSESGRPTIEQLRDPNSTVYVGTRLDVTARFRQRAIDTFHLRDRISEECTILVQEWVDVQEHINSSCLGLRGRAGLPSHFRQMFSVLLQQVRHLNISEHVSKIRQGFCADDIIEEPDLQMEPESDTESTDSESDDE